MTLEERCIATAKWLTAEYDNSPFPDAWDTTETQRYAEVVKEPGRVAVLYTELQGDLRGADGEEPYDIQVYFDLIDLEIVVEIDGSEMPKRGRLPEAYLEMCEEVSIYDYVYAEALDLAEVNGYERV